MNTLTDKKIAEMWIYSKKDTWRSYTLEKIYHQRTGVWLDELDIDDLMKDLGIDVPSPPIEVIEPCSPQEITMMAFNPELQEKVYKGTMEMASAIIMVPDVPNSNGRVYTKEALQEADDAFVSLGNTLNRFEKMCVDKGWLDPSALEKNNDDV